MPNKVLTNIELQVCLCVSPVVDSCLPPAVTGSEVFFSVINLALMMSPHRCCIWLG